MRHLIVLILCVYHVWTRRYDGYNVFDIGPISDTDTLKYVRTLIDDDERLRKVISLSEDVGRSVVISVAVAPDTIDRLQQVLRNRRIPFKVTDTDLQKTFDKSYARNEKSKAEYFARRATGERKAPTAYLRYDDQVAWLQSTAASSPIANAFTFGTTFEGRSMWAISINEANTSLPIIWMDSNIHAREWVTSATNLYIIEQILTGTSAEAIDLRTNYRFYIAPNVNPDGYEYTHTTDRLWRKTRSDHGNICLGVDPNRNFDANFGGEGASSVPCSDTYHGPSAFSEVETAAIRDFLTTISDQCNVYIAMHCYSQLWLIPYGAYSFKPPNYDELLRVGNLAVNAIEGVHGRSFVAGTPADLLSVASGGSIDYTYDALNIAYSYGPELRPATQSEGGFVIDESNIIPSGEEIFAGFYATVKGAVHKTKK